MSKHEFCSIGMLSMAELGDMSLNIKGSEVLAPIIREQFPDRLGAAGIEDDFAAIIGFNDHDDTTFADIERVFEKAELAWDDKAAFAGTEETA